MASFNEQLRSGVIAGPVADADNAWYFRIYQGVKDGDGYEGTGWELLYMHLENRDRVPVGTVVRAGDRLGHPSCEGGVANATHLHLARKYNGEWISADGTLPYVLDGWVSAGLGREYDGYLMQGGVTLEAYDGHAASNEISRP